MSDVTILHNKRCSTSRAAMDEIATAGTDAQVVDYLAHPLDAQALRDLIGKLEDSATDLVRRDAYCAIIGRPKDRVAAFLAD